MLSLRQTSAFSRHCPARISESSKPDILAGQCLEKAEVCRKDSIYFAAQSKMSGLKISKYKAALKLFESISGWRDVDVQIRACQKKIKDLKAKKAAERLEKKRREDEERILSEQRAKRIRRIMWISALLFMCILLICALIRIIVFENKNRRAIHLLNSGNYNEAYELLEDIGKNDAIAQSKYERAIKYIDLGDYEAAYPLLHGINYQDSAQKFEEITPHYYKKVISNAKPGMQLFFGAYEQDNDTSNGKEPIEWIVLEKDSSDNIFVVSKYALDCQCYNGSSSNVTWESCSLRKWLNSEFLSSAFSAYEQNIIKSAVVDADNNSAPDINPGHNVIDKVYLLSIAEINNYFISADARKCRPTPYAVSRGACSDSDNNVGFCCYWLRNSGDISIDAAGVSESGNVFNYGFVNSGVIDGVRPALRLCL